MTLRALWFYVLVVVLFSLAVVTDAVQAQSAEPASGTQCASTTCLAPPSAAPPGSPFDHVRGEIGGGGIALVGFGANKGDFALGFSMSFAAGWGPLPFLLGLEFMAGYGGTSHSQVLVSADDQQFLADRSRVNNTVFLDAWLRFQFPYWPVRPFLEGLVGTAQVRTKDSLSFVGSDTRTNITAEHDWTSTLGWGAGVDFAGFLHLGRGVTLSLSFRHLGGGKATFERTAPELGIDGDVRYRASTGLNLYMIGFVGLLDLAGSPP